MKSLGHAFGFTKLELVIVVAVMGILASAGIPAISSTIPDYRLKNAVRDLYSNMQLAKLRAIRSSETHRIEFETIGLWYEIVDKTGTTIKRVSLLEYEPGGDIHYGPGNATKPAGGTWHLESTCQSCRLSSLRRHVTCVKSVSWVWARIPCVDR